MKEAWTYIQEKLHVLNQEYVKMKEECDKYDKDLSQFNEMVRTGQISEDTMKPEEAEILQDYINQYEERKQQLVRIDISFLFP